MVTTDCWPSNGSASAHPPADFPRQRRYEYISTLGEGTTSCVFLALDREVLRKRALKAPRPHAEGVYEYLIGGEAQLLASIDHPSVARFFTIDHDDDGRPFIVTEYCEGETLARLLTRRSLRRADALAIAEQLADILHVLHNDPAKILHLDVKPANIMVLDGNGPGRKIKLLDLGLGRATYRSQDDTGPQAMRGRALGGTYEYMSPEQFGGEPVDERADAWAFGCVLWECLTNGKRPFGTAQGATYAQCAVAADPSWEQLEDVPARVLALLEYCLRKNPEARLRHLGHAAQELREAQARPVSPTAGAVHNLRHRVTRFVGRERALEGLSACLERSRLVIVSGLPGAGKTRLVHEFALRAARRSPGCAYAHIGWVDLAPLPASADERTVAGTVCSALRNSQWTGEGTRLALPDTNSCAAIGAWLRGRRFLLVLDDADLRSDVLQSVITDLVQIAPDLCVVVTTSTGGELCDAVVLRLDPLEVRREVSGNDYLSPLSPAARFFVELASSHAAGIDPLRHDRASIEEIVQSLDGLPAAIELVVRHMGAAPCGALRHFVRHAISTGRDEGLAPHAAMVRWALDRASPAERTLLARLLIFEDGFDFDAAVAVCADDPEAELALVDGEPVLLVLRSLVERSLLPYDPASDRYRVLRMVRRVVEAFETGIDPAVLRRRFVDHFTALGDEGFVRTRSDRDGVAPRRREAPALSHWLERVRRNELNLTRALSLADSMGDIESMATLVHGLEPLWTTTVAIGTGRRWVERLSPHLAEIEDRKLRVGVLNVGGLLELLADELDRAEEHFKAALQVAREISDRFGEAGELVNLGIIARRRGRDDEARGYYISALRIYRSLGDPAGSAAARLNLAVLHKIRGRLRRAERPLRRLRAHFERTGDETRLSRTSQHLGEIAVAHRGIPGALESFATSLEIDHAQGAVTDMLAVIMWIGGAAALVSSPDQAMALTADAHLLLHHIRPALAQQTMRLMGAAGVPCERACRLTSEAGGTTTIDQLWSRARETVSAVSASSLLLA